QGVEALGRDVESIQQRAQLRISERFVMVLLGSVFHLELPFWASALSARHSMAASSPQQPRCREERGCAKPRARRQVTPRKRHNGTGARRSVRETFAISP